MNRMETISLHSLCWYDSSEMLIMTRKTSLANSTPLQVLDCMGVRKKNRVLPKIKGLGKKQKLENSILESTRTFLDSDMGNYFTEVTNATTKTSICRLNWTGGHNKQEKKTPILSLQIKNKNKN
jgi:hypothetical protein